VGHGIMVAFVAIGGVAGTLLGTRFKVSVLLGATLIATGAIVLTCQGLRSFVLTEVGTLALLQVGYVIGCGLRATARIYLFRKRLDATNQQKLKLRLGNVLQR
jgi:hypothetical protein